MKPVGSNNLPQSTTPLRSTVLTEKAEAEGRVYTRQRGVGQQVNRTTGTNALFVLWGMRAAAANSYFDVGEDLLFSIFPDPQTHRHRTSIDLFPLLRHGPQLDPTFL